MEHAMGIIFPEHFFRLGFLLFESDKELSGGSGPSKELEQWTF